MAVTRGLHRLKGPELVRSGSDCGLGEYLAALRFASTPRVGATVTLDAVAVRSW